MKTLNQFIREKMLSEDLGELNSDSISYSADVWFRNDPSLKDDFYSAVDAYNINGKVPDESILNNFANKIDLKQFVDFVMGDAKIDTAQNSFDYKYILKKILQTAKRQ